MPRERLPDRRKSALLDMDYQGASYSLCVGLSENGTPGSDIDGLLSDVGVLLSRALQFGDSIEALAAGMGRLGDQQTPSSIVGAILDRVVLECAAFEAK